MNDMALLDLQGLELVQEDEAMAHGGGVDSGGSLLLCKSL